MRSCASTRRHVHGTLGRVPSCDGNPTSPQHTYAERLAWCLCPFFFHPLRSTSRNATTNDHSSCRPIATFSATTIRPDLSSGCGDSHAVFRTYARLIGTTRSACSSSSLSSSTVCSCSFLGQFSSG